MTKEELYKKYSDKYFNFTWLNGDRFCFTLNLHQKAETITFTATKAHELDITAREKLSDLVDMSMDYDLVLV